jgi:hypothetical protein
VVFYLDNNTIVNTRLFSIDDKRLLHKSSSTTHSATQRLVFPPLQPHTQKPLSPFTMFPADCLPTHYLETRTQQDLAHQKATAEKRPTPLAQPTPQRPTMTRALSSALFSFFPSASTSTSTSTSPSATPLPSPGLSQGSKMGGWFGVLPRADESDIAVSFAH